MWGCARLQISVANVKILPIAQYQIRYLRRSLLKIFLTPKLTKVASFVQAPFSSVANSQNFHL